jgi:hypothetical protein
VPTHEELARFLRRFNRLPVNVRRAFIAAALQLAEDLGDRGFDPTIVRPQLRLHKLSGENVWSISFAGQYRAVFQLGEQRRAGHAHIVWEFIGSHDEYEREY